jgi:hypothetical protein
MAGSAVAVAHSKGAVPLPARVGRGGSAPKAVVPGGLPVARMQTFAQLWRQLVGCLLWVASRHSRSASPLTPLAGSGHSHVGCGEDRGEAGSCRLPHRETQP